MLPQRSNLAAQADARTSATLCKCQSARAAGCERYAANEMWRNWARVLLTSILCVAVASAAYADGGSPRTYKPVFAVDLTPQSGPVVAAYLQAYDSPTPVVAVKRWEKFLSDYATDPSIGDLTELTLVRQANLELMRLYYQDGRVREADALLRRADEFAVFSLPEPAKAKLWCQENKYCE